MNIGVTIVLELFNSQTVNIDRRETEDLFFCSSIDIRLLTLLLFCLIECVLALLIERLLVLETLKRRLACLSRLQLLLLLLISILLFWRKIYNWFDLERIWRCLIWRRHLDKTLRASILTLSISEMRSWVCFIYYRSSRSF